MTQRQTQVLLGCVNVTKNEGVKNTKTLQTSFVGGQESQPIFNSRNPAPLSGPLAPRQSKLAHFSLHVIISRARHPPLEVGGVANEWDWGWVGQTIVTYIMTSRGRQKSVQRQIEIGGAEEGTISFPSHWVWFGNTESDLDNPRSRS